MKTGLKCQIPFHSFKWTTKQITNFFEKHPNVIDPIYYHYADHIIVSFSLDGITTTMVSFHDERPYDLSVFAIVNPKSNEENTINDNAIKEACSLFEDIISYDAREINIISDYYLR